MSWPSMATVCQPKARQRRSKLPRSCACWVARLWPRPFTSMMPTRLSRAKNSPAAAASHTDPSATLAIAQQHVRAVVGADAAGVEGDADAGAEPLAQRASGDVHEGQTRRGVPLEVRGEQPQREQIRAPDSPASAQAAYSSGAAWPFDSTKRSACGCCGCAGSNRISEKNRAATRSAADMHVVGCPLPASVVARIDSMRSRVAMFFRAGTRDVSTGTHNPPARECSSAIQTSATRKAPPPVRIPAEAALQWGDDRAALSLRRGADRVGGRPARRWRDGGAGALRRAAGRGRRRGPGAGRRRVRRRAAHGCSPWGRSPAS